MSAGLLLFVAVVALSGLVQSATIGSAHGASGKCSEVLAKLKNNETVEDCDYTAETLPECDRNGNFKPKQCHALTQGEASDTWCQDNQQGGECFQVSNGRVFKVVAGVEWCVCVDPLTGHMNKSTAMPASEELQCEECNTGVLDVVFVIDSSGSVGRSNFELVKQFVDTTVDAFDISETGTHVGLIQYSNEVQTEFTLDQFSSPGDVKEAVAQMQYIGGGTRTGSALKHMFTTSFSPAEGAREGVQRVGIVFTDGMSQDDVSQWASKAKRSGITMYAVGIGDAVQQELKEIATEPKENHVFNAEDFGIIEEITKNLTVTLCKGQNYGPCEVMLWKLENNITVEVYLPDAPPRCDDHGNFQPKQCQKFKKGDSICVDEETRDQCYHFDEGEEWCACVDPLTGHVDQYTHAPAELEMHCGKCREMLEKIENHEPVEHEDYMPDMVPECTEYGNFKPKQCHVFNKGDEWCDDDNPDQCYHFDDGEGWCICVDPLTGRMDKHSPAPAEVELHCRKTSGLCATVAWMLENNKTLQYGDFRDDFVLECDDHGNFKPKQCHVFHEDDNMCDVTGTCHSFKKGEEWCLCTDHQTGMPDPTTFTPAGEELHCGLMSGPCHDWLWMIKNNKTKKHGDFRDDFVPECDDHGNFKPKQCHVYKHGDQWCDKKGHCYHFQDGEEWCICIDPLTGEPDEDTVTPGGVELHCGETHVQIPIGEVAEPRCPKDWSLFSEHGHEHCFIYVDAPKTWVEAERYCQFEGGHLASIHCPETEHFLQLLTRGDTHVFPIAWVGATNAVQPCFWFWADGQFFNYENWEKDDARLSADRCLQINHACSNQFKWGSGSCNETHPFVCGIEPGHDYKYHGGHY